MSQESNGHSIPQERPIPNVCGDEGQTEGVWADGPLVLMRRNATLPARCIKTNRRDIVFVEETATRLHVRLLGMALFGTLAAIIMPGVDPALKWAFLLIVIGIVGGGLLLFPRFRLQLPVCRAVVLRRRVLLTVGWTLFAIGMALEGIAIMRPPEQVQTLQQCLILVFILVGAGAAALFFTSYVGIQVVNDEYVWLTGFGREYLASLPQKPPS